MIANATFKIALSASVIAGGTDIQIKKEGNSAPFNVQTANFDCFSNSKTEETLNADYASKNISPDDESKNQYVIIKHDLPKKWTKSTERRFNALIFKISEGKATKDELEDFYELKALRSEATSSLTADEIIEQMNSIRAMKDFNKSIRKFEMYAK